MMEGFACSFQKEIRKETKTKTQNKKLPARSCWDHLINIPRFAVKVRHKQVYYLGLKFDHLFKVN